MYEMFDVSLRIPFDVYVGSYMVSFDFPSFCSELFEFSARCFFLDTALKLRVLSSLM
jgi:hypothetical protein